MSFLLLDKQQKKEIKAKRKIRRAPRLGAHKYFSNALLLLQAFGMSGEEIEIAWSMIPIKDRWNYIERLFELKIDINRDFSDFEFSILRVVADSLEVHEFLDECLKNPLEYFKFTGPIYGRITYECKMSRSSDQYIKWENSVFDKP